MFIYKHLYIYIYMLKEPLMFVKKTRAGSDIIKGQN